MAEGGNSLGPCSSWLARGAREKTREIRASTGAATLRDNEAAPFITIIPRAQERERKRERETRLFLSRVYPYVHCHKHILELSVLCG